MGCFDLGWFENILIWLIIICSVIAILKILVPWVLSIAGITLPPPLLAIINIVVWAVVAIAVVIFVFTLISCLMHMGGHLSLLPRG